ncbi:hypothetical protein ACUXV3_10735 [Roseobacteraceae bacterium NS-SX3]
MGREALRRPVLAAAAAYFALVFACGFVLGTLRILVLLPAAGELGAVLAELPVILAFSWWAAGRLTRGRPALQPGAARLGMGGWAFALLMAAEFVLATTAMGLDGAAFAGRWGTLPGALGLAGQIVFALIPWLRLQAGR